MRLKGTPLWIRVVNALGYVGVIIIILVTILLMLTIVGIRL